MKEKLGSGDLKQIVAFAEGYDLVAIDEAQQIPGIGMGLKILVDHLPDLRIIATGRVRNAVIGQYMIHLPRTLKRQSVGCMIESRWLKRYRS